MKKSGLLTIIMSGCAIGAMTLLSCSSKSNIITIPVSQGDSFGGPVTLPEPAPGRYIGPVPSRMLPKATVFKMSGDYADHVAVTLDDKGNLVYFPAITDVNANSAPTAIGDGWYLNRQGLGQNSVFTKWTFAEYHALDKTPTPEEIKDAILPGARVTSFRTLDVPASEAMKMKPEELLKKL